MRFCRGRRRPDADGEALGEPRTFDLTRAAAADSIGPMGAGLLVLTFLLCVPASWCDTPASSANGRSLFNQGKYAEAAAVLEKAAARGQADATDLAVLGLCYVNLERLDDAERVLSTARLLGPSNSLVYTALGTLAFTRKDYDLAITQFERASRLDPGAAQAKAGLVASLVNRGVSLFQSGKTAEARKTFQSALAVDPRAVQAMRNLGVLELNEGNAKPAAELFEKALALSVEDPELLKLLVAALEVVGDDARLLQAVERLTKAEPSNADAFAALGILLERQGESGEAEEAFARAGKLGTAEPYPYLHLARLSIAKGQTTEAANLLRQAVGKSIQKAGRIEAQAARGVGARQGALAPNDLARLERLSRQVEEPRRILNESLRLLRSIAGDPQAFEADLLELCSWYPQSIDLQVTLGGLYQEQGRWQEARELWERLLEKHPTIVEAHLGLALALERSGSLPEASNAYLRAMDLAPDRPEAYDGLERVYRSLHREEDLASRLLDRSVLDSRNPLLFSRLGRLERELGRLEDSRTHLEQAARLEQLRD